MFCYTCSEASIEVGEEQACVQAIPTSTAEKEKPSVAVEFQTDSGRKALHDHVLLYPVAVK